MIVRSPVLANRLRFLLLVFGIGVLASPVRADAAGPGLTYQLPLATHASSITLASDGAIWFSAYYGTEHEGNSEASVGRLGPDRHLTEFLLPEGYEAGAPVAVSSGDAWFPIFARGERRKTVVLAEYSPDGRVQGLRFGRRLLSVDSMTLANEELWLAGVDLVEGRKRGVIGRIPLATGAMQQFQLESHCWPSSIVAAADAVWFGELCDQERPKGTIYGRSSIVRIDAAGVMTRTPIRRGDAPRSSAVGPDGTVWFGIDHEKLHHGVYFVASRIVRVAVTGEEAEIPVPTAAVRQIAVGPEQRLWFGSARAGKAIRTLNSIGAQGDLGKPICIDPKCELEPTALASGPAGSLLFGAGTANSPLGGGESGVMEDQFIANQAGFIGMLPQG